MPVLGELFKIKSYQGKVVTLLKTIYHQGGFMGRSLKGHNTQQNGVW